MCNSVRVFLTVTNHRTHPHDQARIEGLLGTPGSAWAQLPPSGLPERWAACRSEKHRGLRGGRPPRPAPQGTRTSMNEGGGFPLSWDPARLPDDGLAAPFLPAPGFSDTVLASLQSTSYP